MTSKKTALLPLTALLLLLTMGLSGCSVGSLGAAPAPTATPLPSATALPTATAPAAAAVGGGAGPLAGAVTSPPQPGCTGYKTFDVPVVPALQKNKTYRAIIETNKGTITAKLLPEVAPIAVQSFVFLAQHHYFDNVSFHRVIPGFMIQGGDPTGTGACGPGYSFPDSTVTLPYQRGTLAMANAGPNTNGSQFFIMHQNYQLPPNYVIFGTVTSGIDVVDRITSVPLGANGSETSRPLQKVYMKSVRITIS